MGRRSWLLSVSRGAFFVSPHLFPLCPCGRMGVIFCARIVYLQVKSIPLTTEAENQVPGLPASSVPLLPYPPPRIKIATSQGLSAGGATARTLGQAREQLLRRIGPRREAWGQGRGAWKFHGDGAPGASLIAMAGGSYKFIVGLGGPCIGSLGCLKKKDEVYP